MLNTSAYKGFTLLELLLSLSIGLFVIGGILLTFNMHGRANVTSIAGARLTHDLRQSMQMMSSDLRRAGYWASAASNLSSGTNTNPFMQTVTDITLNATNDCVTFAYDYDNNGVLPAIGTPNSDERYGYRLINGKLQTRPVSYTSHSCTDPESAWDNLTDPSYMQITNFSITPNLSSLSINSISSAKLVIRNYTISITGRLKNDTSVTRTLTETIRVRNDLYVP